MANISGTQTIASEETREGARKGGPLRMPVMLDDELLEALPAAVYVCDLDGVVVRYNKRAAELWGRSPIPGDANELYCGAHRLYLPNGQLMPHNQTPMVDAMQSGLSYRNLDVQMEQPNGRRIWVLVSIDPLRDVDGRIVGAINCFQDVTDRKLEQERKRRADELGHRVKNTLAVVQSIASQTFKNVTGTDAPQVFESRLTALARAHDILGRDDWQGGDLKEIVERVLAPMCGDRCSFEGPSVKLDPKTTINLALAFQEMATNAHKYGALSNPDGRVRLTWKVTREPPSHTLAIDWVEEAGFEVKPPTRKGLGTSLIQNMLTHDHQGTVRFSYPPTGMHCELRLPIVRLEEDEPAPMDVQPRTWR